MNRSAVELQRELEQATSRQLAEDAARQLPKEVAELRDGWLAFGQLLAESDRSFDPQSLLAALAAEIDPPQPRRAGESNPATFGGLGGAYWAAAVAMLLLLSGALAARQFGWLGDRLTWRGATIASGDGEGSSQAFDPPPDSASELSGSAWEDSFDEQLALTHQRLWQVRARSTVGELRYETLRQAVDEFDSELNDGSL